MEIDTSIKTTYDNRQIELVYNEFFLCPVRDIGMVDLELGAKVFNWKMRIVFDNTESQTQYSTKWEYNVDGFQVKLTLFKWTSQNWVELRTPFILKSSDETILYVKFKTEATHTFEFGRTFHISIWKAL